MRYFMRLTQVAASPVETVRVAELVEVDRRALLWVADAVLKGSTFDHAVELSLGATCSIGASHITTKSSRSSAGASRTEAENEMLRRRPSPSPARYHWQ